MCKTLKTRGKSYDIVEERQDRDSNQQRTLKNDKKNQK